MANQSESDTTLATSKPTKVANSGNELAESLKNLKKVIPLMGKYSIPVTPVNYAVWYTYVAESNAEVTKRLNKAIQNDKLITSMETGDIYTECLESNNALSAEKFRRNLEAMLIEVNSSFGDAIKSTNSFSGLIDGSLGRLARRDEEGLSLEETMSLVQKLVNGSATIQKHTQVFVEQLNKTQQEINTLREELNKARNEAVHDALTGLFNRRAMELESAELSARGQKYSIVMLDVDHFKAINDTYGHTFGDSVLKAVAKTANDVFTNAGGHVYRTGGEEFVALLPITPLSSAVRLAENCRRRLTRISIRALHNDEVVSSVRASFGVAEWNEHQTFSETLDRADQMLYKAKEQGRNRVMPIIM